MKFAKTEFLGFFLNYLFSRIDAYSEHLGVMLKVVVFLLENLNYTKILGDIAVLSIF